MASAGGSIQIQHLLKLNNIAQILYCLLKNSNTTFVKVKFQNHGLYQ